jgi:Protein of unknown function (DUF3017)
VTDQPPPDQPPPAQPPPAQPPEQPPGGQPRPVPHRRLDPLAAVAVTVAAGVVVAALHHPRAGMFVACAGLGAGAAIRLLLSPRNAGSLVVRNRRVDVVVLAGLAVVLGVLAAVTPFPAGQG